jgi:hypothetical protein
MLHIILESSVTTTTIKTLCILAVLIAGICFQKKKKNLARNL